MEREAKRKSQSESRQITFHSRGNGKKESVPIDGMRRMFEETKQHKMREEENVIFVQ